MADTHGIVYAPRQIVDFMCASVEEVLDKEFGLTLGRFAWRRPSDCAFSPSFGSVSRDGILWPDPIDLPKKKPTNSLEEWDKILWLPSYLWP